MTPHPSRVRESLGELRFDAAGLLPVVAQDAFTGRVLMLAWANAVAVEKTLATGEAHFWSRSRRTLWRKGETSGNVLRVVAIERDCDGDSLLLRVHPEGPACHTGATSCFDVDPEDGAARPGGLDLGALERIVAERADADPMKSYTARLLQEGIERMAQKVGEEATEVVIAALAAGTGAAAVPLRKAERLEQERIEVASRPPVAAATAEASSAAPAPKAPPEQAARRQRLVEEASDLLFHLTVLLHATGVSTQELAQELSSRHRSRIRPAEESRAPLPKNNAELTPVPPEQSERTDPPPPRTREEET